MKKVEFKKPQELPLMGYKDHNSFYASKKWRKLREFKLSNNPLCEKCAEERHFNFATEVDHIIPIVQNESLALDISNLQSLCSYHHKVKTATEQSQKGKGKILGKKYNL